MEPVRPILIAHLFPDLNRRLVSLLRGLDGAHWDMPTTCSLWRVKDLVAHLLDGQLRRLSFQRDRHPPPKPVGRIEEYGELVQYLNELNADWVRAARRLSPRLLTDLIEIAGAQVSDLFLSLDPFEPAPFAVAWAGEESSPNWFDVARELTEQWLHQQQLREAVGAPGLTEPQFLAPVLDTFMRALPHAYRDLAADNGVLVELRITGESGGSWSLLRRDASWHLYAGVGEKPVSVVSLDQDTAWRLFTKGISRKTARAELRVHGRRDLGEKVLDVISVMA